nr:hypothetical protein [uncultured Caproiciproducens sp.]
MRKKILPLLLVILITVSFVACSPKAGVHQDGTASTISLKNRTPEETVKNALDALVSLDLKIFNQYVDNNDTKDGAVIFKDNKLFGDKTDQEDEKLIKSFVSSLSYKITKVNEQGDSAKVKVQITNKDLSGVLSTLVGDKEHKELVDLINSVGVEKQFDVELSLIKEETGWKIIMSTEFANAVLGGMLSSGILNLQHLW